MSIWRLSELAATAGGQLRGADRGFAAVSTDTRHLRAGELFIALTGPCFDGHDFVDTARDRGAIGALVARFVDTPLPQVQVEDTRAGLAQFSAKWRTRFGIPVVAITGSNGKTTVKNMLAGILARRFDVLATKGNLNNEIGVPLTLLRLRGEHEAAVIELGANHPGEIAALTGLVRPTIGIVTNAAAAHLEGFGTVEGVARAKGELFEYLYNDGTAVINADDVYRDLWLELAGERRVLTFGCHPDADFRVSDVEQQVANRHISVRFTLHTRDGTSMVRLPLAGQHNAVNAAGAAAAAWATGADFADIVAGLQNAAPTQARLQILEAVSGALLIDDCYNANPSSLTAAMQFLVGLHGVSWLVLGDMGELGSDAVRWHREMGLRAKEYGITRLFGLGEQSRHAVESYGSGGEWFEDIDTLANTLKTQLGPGINLLVKGSRMMRLERLVAELRNPQAVPLQANGG